MAGEGAAAFSKSEAVNPRLEPLDRIPWCRSRQTANHADPTNAMTTRIFKGLSVLTGLLYLWLFYQLLFTPVEMLKSFGIDADLHAVYLAKRISALVLGFSALLLLGFRLGQSAARAVVASAVSVNMAGFAINSFWGATHGLLTDPAIPVVGSVEALIALGFGAIAVADLCAARKRAA